MTLPKINIKKTEMTDVDFREELEKATAGSRKFIQPGNQDLKITKKEVLGPAPKDATWYNVQLTLADSDGAEIRAFVMIPTASLKYKSEKGAMLPAKNLTEFFAAIGEDFSPSNATALLNKYFYDDKVLGKVVNVDCGYRSNWVKWVSKDTYMIVDKNGHTYKDENGEPFPVFNTREAAETYAKDVNLKIDSYINVLKFNPSEVAENENEGDDLPF